MALVFAVMHLYNICKICIASVHSFLILYKKYDIDKYTEWSTIPACPSLMFFCFFVFFNGVNTEGTNSSKILSLTFVYVLLYVNLCQD